ncbi:MAG: DNA polymerase III subunit delta' [Clostridia bacterium]|nr:DNA polymerase III subunit delta' [Clostridia bacterium]
MIFENIIGNKQNKEILNKIIKSNNMAHSYMFIGKDSIGKMMFAKEFAKAILCIDNQKPCNKCKSCIEFNTSNNPDFTVIEPEGNAIKIDQIRELVKKVYEKPIVSNKKVYIINDSNLMTKEAQNSLLKTLEEPPEYVTIILIASNENLFLPTIKSRCTKIIFNKLLDNELKEILEKQYNYINVPDLVLKAANGSIKKAVNLQGKEEDYKKINNIYSNLESVNIIDIINSKEEVFKDKEQVIEILEYINLVFFEKITLNANYIECMKILEETKDRLKKNNNFDMTIDNFNMTIWEEINGKHYRS